MKSKDGSDLPSGEAARRKLFLERLSILFPQLRAQDLQSMLELELKTSFRVNSLREPSVANVSAELISIGLRFLPYDWMPGAFYLESEEQRSMLVQSDPVTSGRVFIQNPSSYLPVLALAAKEGESILDMCSAPGGKASLIAALTQNQAELWLNDKLPARVEKLKSVLSLLDVRATKVLQVAAEYLGKCPELNTKYFDKILLDAQCTGEGLVNFRDRNALQYWSLQRVEKYSYLQQRMLVAGFRLLKPGGTLVYSTCTFSPEENEKPISFLLKKFPDARVAPLTLPIPREVVHAGRTEWQQEKFSEQLKHAIRIQPNGNFEGFFVCKIIRDTAA